MADSTHLEKMGRELKCPICLSLLNFSVSLSCNHVFCNSCIQKSMKSTSTCPVCKVPYRRREIRPAPHMDSLVNIYKSMEVASGVNIFDTQSKMSEPLPEEDKQLKSTKSGRKGKSKAKKQQKKPSNENHENKNDESVDRERPCFPTKKRVQVPKYPPSQDPDQPANLGCGLESIVLKETPTVNGEEQSYTPFFWLRDEDDAEKSSQQTDPSQCSQNSDTPAKAPCFSDLENSDEVMPDKSFPNEEKDITSKNVDYFDSEMFEWTQRPCSPELCSTPIKTRVEDTEEFNEIPEKDTRVASTIGKNKGNENRVNGVSNLMADDVEASLVDLLTLGTRKNSVRNCRAKNVKNNSEDSGAKIQKTRARTTKAESIQAQVDSEKKAGSSGGKEHEKTLKPLDLDGPTPKGIKKVLSGNRVVKQVSKCVPALSTEECDMVLDNLVVDKPNSSTHKERKSKNDAQKRKDCPSSVEVTVQSDSKCARELRKSKRQKTPTNVLAKDTRPVVDGLDGVSFADIHPSKDFPYKCNIKDQLPTSIEGVLRKCDRVPSKVECAFCHSTEDSEATGAMVHYFGGKPVAADYNGGSKLKHAHRNCTEWAPNVYFEDDIAINLEAELSRSRRIKCCCCNLKGAALGCYETSCRKSFHVPCAKSIPECRWDNDNFVMLCPIHASSKLPNEIDVCQNKTKRSIVKRSPQSCKHKNAEDDASKSHQKWSTHRAPGNLVLCCSALTNEEREIVTKFKELSGITVLKNWDTRVTHVIASTDENGACRRTLKFLMGILEGKWILSIEWVKACIAAMEPVDEQMYEVGIDIHGAKEGPRLGRLRVLNKQPKIFDAFNFYLNGDFEPSYKGFVHDLLVAAGGTVLHRKPISTDQNHTFTYIVYSVELPDKSNPAKKNVILERRRLEAEALARSSGAKVANNSWVLNSIATGKLQNFE